MIWMKTNRDLEVHTINRSVYRSIDNSHDHKFNGLLCHIEMSSLGMCAVRFLFV